MPWGASAVRFDVHVLDSPELEEKAASSGRAGAARPLSLDVLLLDNKDSFTFNIAHVCAELGASVDVVDSDLVTAEQVLQSREAGLGPAVVIIGPGPRSPRELPRLVELVAALDGVVPLFGICLGLQVIVRARGGVVGRAERPVHGKRDAITHTQQGCLQTLPSPLWVMRYHSLVAVDVPASLEVTAVDAAGQPMAVRDRRARLEAVQFHPESIGTAGGVELVAAILRGAGVAVSPQRRAKTVPPSTSRGPGFDDVARSP